jgi:uncharacterized protein (DUF488 family)
VARVVTIGVYGFTVERFMDELEGADVTLLLDVRQRRGVRGREYAWANSKRLQDALAEREISYRHVKELATPDSLRELQQRDDARQGVGQRSRTRLAPEFERIYSQQVLDRFDLAGLAASLPDRGATALLCVESVPAACHRSLIAARLAAEHGLEVRDLTP